MDIITNYLVEGRIRHGLPMLGSCRPAVADKQVSLSHAGHGFGSVGGFADRPATDSTFPNPSGRPDSPPV